MAALPALTGCGRPPDTTERAEASAETYWRPLGIWSGEGSRQTESFEITTGSLRLAWVASGDGSPIGERIPSGAAPAVSRLRVTLHSAISGRPLETLVDTTEPGSDTLRVAAEPRVAYLLVESAHLDWELALEEGIAVGAGS